MKTYFPRILVLAVVALCLLLMATADAQAQAGRNRGPVVRRPVNRGPIFRSPFRGVPVFRRGFAFRRPVIVQQVPQVVQYAVPVQQQFAVPAYAAPAFAADPCAPGGVQTFAQPQVFGQQLYGVQQFQQFGTGGVILQQPVLVRRAGLLPFAGRVFRRALGLPFGVGRFGAPLRFGGFRRLR